jgi:hypothetical protein
MTDAELRRRFVEELTDLMRRSKLSTYQEAIMCWYLRERLALSGAAIAPSLGKTGKHVDNLVRAAQKLHQKIVAKWRGEHRAATTTTLFKLAALPLKQQLPKAIERCMEVSYDEYKAQVVSYLKPDQIEALGSREAWDALQVQVVDFLEKALP